MKSELESGNLRFPGAQELRILGRRCSRRWAPYTWCWWKRWDRRNIPATSGCPRWRRQCDSCDQDRSPLPGSHWCSCKGCTRLATGGKRGQGPDPHKDLLLLGYKRIWKRSHTRPIIGFRWLQIGDNFDSLPGSFHRTHVVRENATICAR